VGGEGNHCVICEACEGERFLRGRDEAGGLMIIPCLECIGGVSSCCDAPQAQPSFECPSCGAVSYNPNDIRERYCGRCHAWQL
jgi:hypothetical protein